MIEARTKALVEREKGPCDFFTQFREEPLEPHLDRINASRAVLLPAFPVRDTPMYPGTYRLVEDLDCIRVPLIPIGANWNTYPGDERSRAAVWYSDATQHFLRRVAARVTQLSCREYYTCDVLSKHGIDNTIMTGDPAWFHLPAMGTPLHRPRRVERLVFSPPLSPYYVDQAKRVMEMLANLLPEAERICAFHLRDAGSPGGDQRSENSAAMRPEVAAKNRAIREWAAHVGFSLEEMGGELAKLDLYQTCDLHVGYECHAHLNFFSRRRPSVLIAEDARGVGFNATLGVGGFDGFVRAQDAAPTVAKTITSGYCTSLDELALAPPRLDVHRRIEAFLRQEIESGFRRYLGLPAYLDDVYETRMRPFLRSVP